MNKDHIIQSLKEQIKNYQAKVNVDKVGTVAEIGDGICKISGLAEVMASEMLDFGNNIFGVALNLEDDFIGAMFLSEYQSIKEGHTVKSTGRILEVPVGQNLIGRVVNPLG